MAATLSRAETMPIPELAGWVGLYLSKGGISGKPAVETPAYQQQVLTEPQLAE
jgi:hypothetical protein